MTSLLVFVLGKRGSTVVAGVKGLVKQTQSNSIYKSSSALAALVRVSLPYYRSHIYVHVSHIEPIFHMETIAGSLPCSHPEKKWFLFLVKLARETLIAVREPSHHLAYDPVLGAKVWQMWPSPETALNLRQRLIRVLRFYRSSGLDSLEDTIGEACAICAEAVSTCIDTRARGNAYMHILETVYFTVIFVLRSTHDYARTAANRQVYMVLRTLASWVDVIVFRCLHASQHDWRYDIDKLKAKMLFRSLVDVCGPCGTATCMLPPQSLLPAIGISHIHFTSPRRYREASKSAGDDHIAQGLIKGSKDRTRRFLRSFKELEREVCGMSLETIPPTSHSKIDADPHWFDTIDFGYKWWESWKKALESARRVQVPENLVTEEFREARRIGLQCDPFCDPLDCIRYVTSEESGWDYYQLRRGSRHKWGQYLRSNMDGDWGLGTCMKRLFKERHPEQSAAVHGAPVSSPAIGVAASPEGSLQLSFGRVQVGTPKEIKISYETEDGKMQYMSFVPAIPGPEQHPVPIQSSSGSSPAVVLNSAAVQQDSGYREGSFSEKEIEDLEEGGSSLGTDPYGVQQDIEGLEAGASSSDASQPKACKIIAVEECDDGCEGKETAYDGVSDEVRAGGDTLSICLLD